MKNITIIADDLGLVPEISEAIAYCAEKGLIDGAAFLVNTPGTQHALGLLPRLKNIEVGLHLGIVEGYSLTRRASIIDAHRYFPDGPCLYQNWKKFSKDYVQGKIHLRELAEEFDAQMTFFKKNIGPIPFLNGTQHLHMLPGIFQIVLELCQKHNVPKIRVSSVGFSELMFSKKKLLGSVMMNVCQITADSSLKKRGIQSIGKTYGVTCSGDTSTEFMDFVIRESKKKPIELVIHPGYDSPDLRNNLPENYGTFNWEKELASLEYLKEKLTAST
jgi:chitin disaccharide deacetylase